MPEKDVEIVRAHIEAFRSQDTARSASFLDEHVVRDWTRIGILNPAGYGIDAVITGVRHYLAAFEHHNYSVEGLEDLGSGQVLARVAETARGKGSGVPVERSLGVLYTVIDGLIARITAFPNEQDAREAIGATEDSRSG